MCVLGIEPLYMLVVEDTHGITYWSVLTFTYDSAIYGLSR